MKHIKLDFSSNAWVLYTGWTKGLGHRPKFNFFRTMIMLPIKLNGMPRAATWYQLFNP